MLKRQSPHSDPCSSHRLGHQHSRNNIFRRSEESLSISLSISEKEAPVSEPEPERQDERRTMGPRIRCPLCGWSPKKRSRWLCDLRGCGHQWNTFDTGGVCPNCLYQWKETQCLSCNRFSPHSDWYVND